MIRLPNEVIIPGKYPNCLIDFVYGGIENSENYTEPSGLCGRAILSSTNRIMRECVRHPVYFDNSKIRPQSDGDNILVL